MTTIPKIENISIEAATITLRNVQLQDAIVLDEVHLEGGEVRLELPENSAEFKATTGETRVRALMTEPNLNRMLEANLPDDGPVRNLRVAMFSGRASFKGQFVKSVMSLPFSLDAIPVITNGVRLSLDCRGTQIGGIGLPGPAVEVIEKILNERLTVDLSEAPFPVRLDEIRCEPGRLTLLGRARFSWPFGVSGKVPISSESPVPIAAR